MPMTTTPHVRFRTIGGVRIRYADSGSPQERAVVLTSPWPESVYAFAPIWASLAEHARLFAVDLPASRPASEAKTRVAAAGQCHGQLRTGIGEPRHSERCQPG